MGRQTVLVEVDNRRRVPLGKLGRPGDRRYLATVDDHGRILLEPALVMTEAEQRLMTDESFWRRAEAATGQRVTPFALDD
ncbi:MAG: hypothetical protein ACRD0J_01225 [Acidimicrobiales bacterium]